MWTRSAASSVARWPRATVAPRSSSSTCVTTSRSATRLLAFRGAAVVLESARAGRGRARPPRRTRGSRLMPPLGKQRHFEILRQVLALAEERASISLSTPRVRGGVTDGAARGAARTGALPRLPHRHSADYRAASRRFLLTEDGRAVSSSTTTGCATSPPIRLRPTPRCGCSLPGSPCRASPPHDTPDLDRRSSKLQWRRRHATRLARWPHRPASSAAQQAWHDGRSLRFRYLRDNDDVATDREAVPLPRVLQVGSLVLPGPRARHDAEPKHVPHRSHARRASRRASSSTRRPTPRSPTGSTSRTTSCR